MLIVQKKRILTSVALSLVALTSPARPQSLRPNIESRIESILAPWARNSGPGLAALVVDHGRTVYAKGFGLSDVFAKTPIDQETIFDLGSLTKQFTATAVLLLVRDGKVGLDEPVSKIYPEYAKEWSGITVRMLLNHTAGLPDFIALFRAQGPAYNDFPRSTRGASHIAEPDANDMLRLVASAPLQFAPGSSWAYCNSCYILLAGVVERVSNESFAKFVRTNILEAEGMSGSWVNTQEIPSAPHFARSYFPVNHAWEERDYSPLDSALHGAGGVHASISDLAHWYASMDTGSFVLPEQLAALERTSGKTTAGKLTHYGMGWVVDASLGITRIEHGGSWKGFRNVALRYPAQKLTVLLLSNDVSFAPFRAEVAFRIARLFLENQFHMPAGADIPPSVLAQYEGNYAVDSETSYTVRLRQGRLWVNTGEVSLELGPVTSDQFVVRGIEEEKFEFKRGGTELRLIRNEPGLGGTTTTTTVGIRVKGALRRRK